MTKAELIKALEKYPDDIEVRYLDVSDGENLSFVWIDMVSLIEDEFIGLLSRLKIV